MRLEVPSGFDRPGGRPIAEAGDLQSDAPLSAMPCLRDGALFSGHGWASQPRHEPPRAIIEKTPSDLRNILKASCPAVRACNIDTWDDMRRRNLRRSWRVGSNYAFTCIEERDLQPESGSVSLYERRSEAAH